ncbi:MAG: imidazole glycerol phosphate synthase cyclase subunit [Candidatus Peribacteraceae bacterium]|nr:imidazole glycerol phosphate synthase cyclase subunit [Candidatus Peribacteraceae bacterium]MDD5074798.1 imidazole glycerol phosphate synthase cyclase subunit [Candidatus Peribacteraceae bacterium]
MLHPRLIPVLLLKNGILVRSRTFTFHQHTGDPLGQVERFTAWKADELIYLDINRDDTHDFRETMSVIGTTSSHKDIPATMTNNFLDIIRSVSERCMIPLTVGGKIRTLEDIRLRLSHGADKVSINTQALADPSFITAAAQAFGNQCIVVCVDVKANPEKGTHEVHAHFGKDATGLSAVEWCKEAEKRGAGEILLQSIDRDGTGQGYDLPLIRSVAEAVSIPVIALGGAGTFRHFVEGLTEGHASAVAAANIFHFTEQSVINAKKQMRASGIDVRL